LKSTKKRKYSHKIEFLRSGFESIRLTIEELVSSSNYLLKKKQYGQSLSLAIIAFEESGKMFLLDGLLFTNQAHERSKRFGKNTSSHTTKLVAGQFLTALLKIISEHDDRYKKEESFRSAVTIGLANQQEQYVKLRSLLPAEDIRTLDKLKQQGFYSDFRNNKFTSTSSNSDAELTKEMNKLVNLFSQNIRFHMNDNALTNYLDFSSSIREKMTDEDHEQVSALAGEKVEALFEHFGLDNTSED